MHRKEAGSTSPKARAGFTLVEVLVVIALIGLCVVIILPAVQAAREAARRSACSNNLRQMGQALSNFENSKGYLPSSNRWNWSPQGKSLPFLEQGPLANSLNFSTFPDESPETSLVTRLAVFACPSDFVSESPSSISYAANTGWSNVLPAWNGAFAAQETRLSEFTDGMSTTVAVSEWVIGPMGGTSILGRRDPLADTFLIDTSGILLTDINSMEGKCDSINIYSVELSRRKGLAWFQGEIPSTLYDHTSPPNHKSCFAEFARETMAAVTAGSRHPGGAYSLFMDGHAQFVTDSVSTLIWRAIGSRNGSEIVSEVF